MNPQIKEQIEEVKLWIAYNKYAAETNLECCKKQAQLAQELKSKLDDLSLDIQALEKKLGEPPFNNVT